MVAILTFWHLVDLEPFDSGLNETRHVRLHILYVIEFIGHRVPSVDGEQFPICFTFIDQSNRAEDLHWQDISCLCDSLT